MFGGVTLRPSGAPSPARLRPRTLWSLLLCRMLSGVLARHPRVGGDRVRNVRKDIVLPLNPRHPVHQLLELRGRERRANFGYSTRNLTARGSHCFALSTIIHRLVAAWLRNRAAGLQDSSRQRLFARRGEKLILHLNFSATRWDPA